MQVINRCSLLLALMAVLGGCAVSKDYQHEQRIASESIVASKGTRLQDGLAPLLAERAPEESGFYLLNDGLSAFLARAALISAADVSLDLQYYIFAGDDSGKTLLSLLVDAADRGVRVRLLIDDLGTPVSDPWVAVIDAHPLIEIRVFNPVAGRSGFRRTWQQALQFGRINHRMHNKLLVADGLAFITGGRNVGDEYFSSTALDFQDLDVLVIGEVVVDARQSFDTYWNHPASVPLELMLKVDEPDYSETALREQMREFLDQQKTSVYAKAVAESTLAQKLLSKSVPLHWGTANLYVDPPDKAVARDKVAQEAYLTAQLLPYLTAATEEILISSAYFIPGEIGVDYLGGRVADGVKVSVLTNALSTTDVAVVHSGYADYREPLLRAGVSLWELRSQAGAQERIHWFKGASKASLHAKSFVLDEHAAIIGSLNLDGRSVIQNTEIALYVENREINAQLRQTFLRWTAPENAWRLSLDDEKLMWRAQDQEGAALSAVTDPETTGWQRFKVWLLSLLPFEQQL